MLKLMLLDAHASEETYKTLINDYYLHRQDARGVLPLDTATRCVYTYSLREWRHIIDLRYYGTTGIPHPNARLIAGMIRNKGLKEFFKELDSIQPINIIPKEHFYSVFGNVVKDFYSNKEDENNRT